MFKFLFLFVLFLAEIAPLSALEENVDFFNVQSSVAGVLLPPPAVFAHKEISSFLPQIPKVNVVTGEYHEEELDFVVAGSEPLSIRRFYNHLGHKNQAYGHWSINPEALMLFDLRSHSKQRFAGIGEESGNFILCENEQANTFTFDPSKHKSFTGTGRGHPLNVHFSFNKVIPGRYENYWEGVVEDGSGGKRIYRTEIGLWNQENNETYQACIKEERRPNGNVVYYEYEDFNHKSKQNSHYKKLNTYYILRSISAYSSRGVFLGSINLNYSDQVKGEKTDRRRYIHRVDISGSDQRKATFFNHVREIIPKKKHGKPWDYYYIPAIMDVVLDHIQTPSKPTQNYTYHWDRAKYYFDHPYMFYAGQPEGRILETTYDLNSKKVTGQKAPIGPNGEMLPIARYEYQNDHTIVYDGENQKTIYRFNDDKRMTAVEKYDANQLVQVEHSKWNPLNGNLIRKQIEDGSGNILHISEYEYDQNQNVIEEKIGDGKSRDTIKHTFSNNGFNLKETESDRPDKLVRYSYIPDTNLLSSEIIYEQDQIVKRIFHFYDDEITSVRVKTIVDDGHSENPHDIAHVTYRKIFEMKPKRELPCVGLPEEAQEKTLDRQGNEILLKKVCYAYHPSGKVQREDHYDAKDIYRYSIINEYDEKERLIETTDAFGSRTTFTYDANFNLLSQEGPRSDIHKEWSYDKVNRPTQEREWQTDGTILVTEKRYDKCSRQISQTDPCGFETLYEYNALGQIVTITHPDGAIEQKEYDALGNIIQEIDANGHITHKKYNFRSQPTEIYYPDGRKEYFTYNTDVSTLAAYIDPSGTKTVYFYDLFDNPIKTEVYSPEGNLLATTSATFSPFHKLSETDAEGITTYYTYDFAGRLIAQQIGDQTVSYAYNELGQLIHIQEGGSIITNVYDVKGQLIEKRIDGLENQVYFRETYAHDEAGNRISITTSAGTSQTMHNSRGEPIQKIDPLGNTTDVIYSYRDRFIKTTINPKGVQILETHNARGRLTDLQVTNTSGQVIQRREKRYDPSGNQTHSIEHVFEGTTLRETITHEWIYGPGGRLEKVIEAEEKTTQYFYDQAGRLKTIIKPDGAKIHHEYDARGRLSRYYGTGIDYLYMYDHKDRLLEVEDKVHKTTTNRFYDIYDNVVKEKLASGLTIQSQYDPFGRRISLSLPDDSEVTFSYQGPYLYSVSRNGYTHTYSERNLAGKPIQITLPNNSGTICLIWDSLLRWKTVHSPHYKATCSYDSVGNLIKYSHTDPLGSGNQFYQYDDLNQLISENEHDYQYDSLFNRTIKDDNSYSLNPLCQVTHDGQKKYVYDKNGNLISDGESTYEYDLLDRLISVIKDNSHSIYMYDAFNRRIAKNNELYLWDDQNEIGMSCSGKIRELRILGEGLGAEIGSSVIFEIDGYTYFPIHDIQGSPVAMIYTNGEPYGTYRFTAFGEQLTEDSDSPWRFASKRYDEETDFVYFGRRYYSPKLGRWITADPQGFDDGPNLYAYVKNSPLIAIDLYGFERRDGTGASYQGGWRATWDYFFDGFCNIGPGISSRMRAGYEMEWSLISDPIGHSKRLWGNIRDFASQAPQEMNWENFKRGCIGAGEALFPKNAQAIRSLSDNTLDDYTRAYRNQQASLEVVSHCAMFLAGTLEFGAFSKAGGATKQAVATEGFLVSKGGVIKSIDSNALFKAGQVMDRGGLTRAGRALDKHGNRTGGVFPKATGNPASKNIQGQRQLDDILTDPMRKIKYGGSGSIQIYSSDGRGAYFNPDGTFRGFLDN